MFRTLLTLLAALLLAQPASAEIYKCRQPNGKMEISNVPCPSGSDTVTVRPDETVPEASRQQAERDVERMRNYVEKREAAQRADEAAERQEQASQRSSSTSSRTPRAYGSADECLRDLDQMALEATQRARMDAECRSIVNPQTVYLPLLVPTHPHRIHPHPAPKKEAPAAAPSAPRITLTPR